jgi:hypothetical protein
VTPERLAEIREADRHVRIYTDSFGGHYVLRRDACVFGQRAIIHRRELLAALEHKPQRCAATVSSDPPQDCDAPYCGCNPAWTQCIEWLIEAGWKSPSDTTTKEKP